MSRTRNKVTRLIDELQPARTTSGKKRRIAKKRKLPDDDDYAAEFVHKVGTRQKAEPAVVSKYYYDKAVEKIRNYKSKQRRIHPVIEQHGTLGRRVLSTCHSFSMDSLNGSLVQPVSYVPTWSLLVAMLRRALLARNWSYCLRLCDAYLHHSTLRQYHLVYTFRLIFSLMFNLNVSNERLTKFLSFALSIRNDANQQAYLSSLMQLKELFPRNFVKAKRNSSSLVENDPDDISSDEAAENVDSPDSN